MKLIETAVMPNSAPLKGIFLPKKRIRTNEIAGNRAINHAFSRSQLASLVTVETSETAPAAR